MKKKNLTDKQKIKLIKEVYGDFKVRTEMSDVSSFSEDLVYLLGSIAKGGTFCQWPLNRPLVRVLKELYSTKHPIWNFVIIEKGECARCGSALRGGFCTDETCPFDSHLQDCVKGWEGHPEMGSTGMAICTCETKHVIAKFIPQTEGPKGRYIEDMGEEHHIRFDVTDQIKKMEVEEAFYIEDDKETSDALLTDEIIGNHQGPYRVVVAEAIKKYLAR